MRSRTGFTLVEVIIVVAILAASAIGIQMLAPTNAIGSVQASTESRKLVAALRLCRSTAIANQTPVRLRFLVNNRRLTSYIVEVQGAGGNYSSITPVESLANLPVANSNASSVSFTATGAADVGLVVNLGTTRQTHRVTVVVGSGQIRYVKI